MFVNPRPRATFSLNQADREEDFGVCRCQSGSPPAAGLSPGASYTLIVSPCRRNPNLLKSDQRSNSLEPVVDSTQMTLDLCLAGPVYRLLISPTGGVSMQAADTDHDLGSLFTNMVDPLVSQ